MKRIYIWLERVTTRITTKLVVVSYANAEKGEKNRRFQTRRLDSLPRRHFRERVHAAGPSARRLPEWGIPADKVVVGMIACLKPRSRRSILSMLRRES